MSRVYATQLIFPAKEKGSELDAGGDVHQAPDGGICGGVHVVVVIACRLGNPGIRRHPVKDVVDAHGEFHAAEQTAGPACVLNLVEGVGFLEIPRSIIGDCNGGMGEITTPKDRDQAWEGWRFGLLPLPEK